MENDTVDAATISKVMRVIGSKKTAKKTEQATANLAEGRKRLQDPDVRALLSQKQKERRERERQERLAAGVRNRAGRAETRTGPTAQGPDTGRKRTRMTHTELETAYIALCKRVEADLVRIVGMCGNGRADAAGNATAHLLEQVENTRLQYQMQQEQASGYDLAALRVDAAMPSNSETPFENG